MFACCDEAEREIGAKLRSPPLRGDAAPCIPVFHLRFDSPPGKSQEIDGMQLQDKDVQSDLIGNLQSQVSELTGIKLLLEEELAQLKEELAQKERFAAMIAHELRSPLTPIINYAQIIARPNQRRENIERGSQIIVGQAWRLARLAKDLLDASRLSSGQFTLKRGYCDLSKVAYEVVEQMRPVAPFHEFKLELSEESLVGHWDADRLQQALGNLVDNASKYSDDDTVITVRACVVESMLQVSVHNVGMGIPQSQVDLLFRPFSRLQTAVPQDGAGLGLFISRSIIEEHGGKLWLEKLPEGQGTTFTFDLPL
jgi:signal transduction histidine kinase